MRGGASRRMEVGVKISRWWLSIAMCGCVSCGGQTTNQPNGDPPLSAIVQTTYLGLEAPTSEAVVFAPGVVSTPGRFEYGLSIHPGGNRLLFSAESPDQGASVFERRFEHGTWTPPVRAELSDGARKHEMEAFFSVDGERIFFAPYSKGMDVRIWTAEVTPDGFTDPRELGGPVAEDPSFYPVQATDGSLFYTNLAKRAVWQATLDGGKVTDARDAGLEKGGHAFPSPDGSFILIDSASLNSDEQRDIYVSFRKDDGSWGTPKALGPSVNTEFSETCPSLSPDGRFLFFSRYNEPGGISDIYWISSEVIEIEAPV